MKLRVWHVCQIGIDSFHVEVDSVEEAIKIIKTLWDYDMYLYENNIADFSNFSGLEEYDNDLNEWTEYYDIDGRDIIEIINKS